MKTIPQEYVEARVVDLQYHPDNPRDNHSGGDGSNPIPSLPTASARQA